MKRGRRGGDRFEKEKEREEKEGEGENGSAYRAGATAFTVPLGRHRETIITARESFDVHRRVRTPPRKTPFVGVRVVVDGHAHRETIRSYEHEFVAVYPPFVEPKPARIRVQRRARGFLHSSPRRWGFGIRGEDFRLTDWRVLGTFLPAEMRRLLFSRLVAPRVGPPVVKPIAPPPNRTRAEANLGNRMKADFPFSRKGERTEDRRRIIRNKRTPARLSNPLSFS